MQLALSNIINISVSAAQAGVGQYNTSNLGIFTDELPVSSVEAISFSGVAASGTFVLNFGPLPTAAINWNDSISTIQGKIQAVNGYGSVIVTGSIAGESLSLTWPGINGALPLVTVTANSLETAGSASVAVTPVISNVGWSGGASGFALYLAPTQAGVDFGTGSKTSAMVNGIFSQQPNVLLGGGYVCIMPLTVESQTLTLSGVAASGTFVFNYGSHASAAINWNDTASQIQAKLQAIPGLSQVLVTGSIAGELLTVQYAGVYGHLSLATITSNSLETSGISAITITVAESVAGETWGAAITRTSTLVQYFGHMVDQSVAEIGQTDLLAAAAINQPLNKIGFFVSHTVADIQPGGMVDLVRTGGFTQMRGLYYGDTSVVNDLGYLSAYAGLALSTNFNGSNTTQTMNLKSLIGPQPDPSMTQTIQNYATASGADTYPSLQGVPKVLCSGANQYFDQVYNLQWFVGALQVAGFNYLATTSTKIPQTESGMDGLKGAYRNVCEQAVGNQYLAPGAWNSATTFGNQTNFLNNISQLGYYIYSTPVAQQSQTARAARQAPLVQIAIKAAGAIQSSTVVVYVNA